MSKIAIPKDTIIYKQATPLTSLSFIAVGSVLALNQHTQTLLTQTDVIGIVDIETMTHSSTYLAKEDCVLITYQLTSIKEFNTLLKNSKQLVPHFTNSAIRQICALMDSYIINQFECDNLYSFLKDSYQTYIQYCKKSELPAKNLLEITNLVPMIVDNPIEDWLVSYYDDLKQLINKQPLGTIHDYPQIAFGFLMKASVDYAQVLNTFQVMTDYKKELSSLLLNENHLDLFDLYTNLSYRLRKDGADDSILSSTFNTLNLHIQTTPSIPRSLFENRFEKHKNRLLQIEDELQNGSANLNYIQNNKIALSNSLDIILDYANCSNETKVLFQKNVKQYKSIIDKNATDETIRKLRLSLSNSFYEIYKAAFEISLQDEKIPTILQMFFKFGYIDEDLAGLENAVYLYSIADSYKGNENLSIYTIYEWLKAIYEGKKEPSRNEFDLDYKGYLREKRISGKIDKNEEQNLLSDNLEKLQYELSNLFPVTNRLTFGRIITFCPVFSEHNVLKSLEECLITSDKLCGALEKIRELDYTAFYRESIYYNPDLKINKELIQTEILPDIILMPNIGNRGVMWQEIVSNYRNTKARFVLPIFSIEDVGLLMVKLTGEYRFEMCKRTQGARWNDITDPSLTSEYFDYLQFYKKNQELTKEAKEKIKNALTKARNNYKEMFVRDYMIWVLYEGKGSIRLNKLVRKTMFTYCPFPQNIRNQLRENPIYRDIIDKWTIKRAQEQIRLRNLFVKINNSNKDIPEELENQKQFLDL